MDGERGWKPLPVVSRRSRQVDVAASVAGGGLDPGRRVSLLPRPYRVHGARG